MEILFIRHADAEDHPPRPAGGDMERRLTDKGKRIARRVFAVLSAAVPAPARIVSSAAVRARQTAELLSAAYGNCPVIVDKALNPGCEPADFRAVIGNAHPGERLAVVGHQPDLSILISHLVAGDRLALTMKKCACAMVRIDKSGYGSLCWLAPPSLLSADNAGNLKKE